MKKILLIGLFAAISMSVHSQTAAKLVSQSDDMIARKQYDSALLLLNKAWKLDSTQYYVYTSRGMAYVGLEKWEESYNEFSKAITKYPDSAFAYHLRAILLMKLTYNDEAIADNTRALELVDDDSSRLMLFVNRGNAYGQKRDFNHAYEDYSRAYLLDSNNKEVINNMATVLDELGRAEEAILLLKKLVSLDPGFLGSYVNLGFQYTRLGRYKEAIEFFDKALTIEKDEPLTLNNRGLARYHLKDYKGAMEDINRSLSIYKTNSYAFKNRALVWIAMNEKGKACTDLDEAINQGFTEMYGNEVVDLKNLHCSTK